MIDVRLIATRPDGTGAIPVEEAALGPALYSKHSAAAIRSAKAEISSLVRLGSVTAHATNRQVARVHVIPDSKTSRADAEAVARFVRKYLGVRLPVLVIDPDNLETSGLVFI